MAETNPDSDLQFDTSALQGRGETYSSLTDINKIEVFTKSFEKDVMTVKEQEVQHEAFLLEQPFANAMNVDQDNEQIIAALFQGNQQNVLKSNEITSQNRNGLLFSIVGIVFALFLGAMVVYCRNRNQKTKEEKQHIVDSFMAEGD